MKKCLIMITSSYPFLTGEPFIEAEMPYLQSEFDKIITLAIDVGKGAPMNRAIPENADCFNIAVKSKIVSRTESKIIGALNYVKGSDFSDCDDEADSFKRKMFLEYFCARAKTEFKLCMNILKKYDFSLYDSVTVYSYWFFVAAMIGTMIRDEVKKNCRNVRLISRAHGYDVYESVNSLDYLPMRAYLLNKFDAVYPCSVNGEEHIRKRYPVFADKVTHSYLGTSDFGLGEASKNGLHIVSCSRAVSLKRIEKIIGALSFLENSGINNLRWTHIGDGPLLDEMKKLADEKLDFMDFEFKGNLVNSDVLRFYKKNPVDLFINVSNTEGLPVSIMEAISFGIPVLATDVGGVSEIVKNNFNGMLLDVDCDNRDIAAAIKNYYFSDENEKKSKRNNARLYWEQNFNAEKNYSEFLRKII